MLVGLAGAVVGAAGGSSSVLVRAAAEGGELAAATGEVGAARWANVVLFNIV